MLQAKNNLGTTERRLTITVGDQIALTPPMGWNSWNCWAGRVTQDKVLRAATETVAHGLRDHGWTYINIDEGWQGKRGGEFNAIQPNPKFPNIAGLARQIHDMGLKVGIYSSPWRTTFNGHIGSSADYEDGTTDWIRAKTHTDKFKFLYPKDEGSMLDRYSWLQPLAQRQRKNRKDRITKRLRTFGRYSFAEQDARQWSQWGVDYLKYDWVPIDFAHAEVMRRALDATGRDIVFSLSNNADFSVAPGLAKVANAWRTSIDLEDTWKSVSEAGFDLDKWAGLSGPGHFNDPDMLVIGHVSWGKQPRSTRLTSDEQYTHMSLWCLLSAPLLLGCDLEKLDAFTLGLLTNDEVLAVNQDALCKQATRVARAGKGVVYAKQLEDGSWAAGLFNRGETETKVRLNWSNIGVAGNQVVRDLWRQEDIGTFSDRFETSVASHGVVLVRVIPVK